MTRLRAGKKVSRVATSVALVAALACATAFGYSAAGAAAGATGEGRAISPALRRHFSVFRHGRLAHAATATALQSDDAIQSLIDSFISTDSGAPPVSGGSEANVVKVDTSTALGSLWLVPGSDGACLATQLGDRAVGTCNTSDKVTASGIEGWLPSANGGHVLFGLVPDGNASVHVTTSSGVVSAKVTNNTFAVALDTVPLSETFRNGSGAETTVVGPGSG
jgi:hypothetical protein